MFSDDDSDDDTDDEKYIGDMTLDHTKTNKENKFRTTETHDDNQMEIEDLNEIVDSHVNKELDEYESVLNDDEDDNVTMTGDNDGKEKQVESSDDDSSYDAGTNDGESNGCNNSDEDSDSSEMAMKRLKHQHDVLIFRLEKSEMNE